METILNIPPLLLWLLLLSALVVRYFMIAGLPYLWLHHIKRSQYQALKLQKTIPSKKQISREIAYSLITLFIYSSGIWLFVLWLKNDVTLHYDAVGEHGLPYLIVSVPLMIILHDTYYYWTHRLIHHRLLFKHVHLLHHTFKNPTPWCAFAFHPFESILSLGIIPLIMFIMPWHIYAMLFFVTIIIIQDTYIHLGFNIQLLKKLRWHNSSVHHDVHHRDSRFNFGLYFTFWDRVMGTYSKGQQEPI